VIAMRMLTVHSSDSAACDWCVFIFRKRSVKEEHLMRFERETSPFKFPP